MKAKMELQELKELSRLLKSRLDMFKAQKRSQLCADPDPSDVDACKQLISCVDELDIFEAMHGDVIEQSFEIIHAAYGFFIAQSGKPVEYTLYGDIKHYRTRDAALKDMKRMIKKAQKETFSRKAS